MLRTTSFFAPYLIYNINFLIRNNKGRGYGLETEGIRRKEYDGRNTPEVVLYYSFYTLSYLYLYYFIIFINTKYIVPFIIIVIYICRLS
jgi:hypothetical protein